MRKLLKFEIKDRPENFLIQNFLKLKYNWIFRFLRPNGSTVFLYCIKDLMETNNIGVFF